MSPRLDHEADSDGRFDWRVDDERGGGGDVRAQTAWGAARAWAEPRLTLTDDALVVTVRGPGKVKSRWRCTSSVQVVELPEAG